MRDAPERVELTLFAIRCLAGGSAARAFAVERIKPSVC